MNLSPAAQAFWGSVIRHILTAIAGVLVAHGYVSNDVAHPYIEEGVGMALQGAVMLWANRIVYWQQIRAIVGRSMPAATHTDVVAKVEALKEAQALPSVFTAPTTVPSLVKPAIVLLVALLGGMASACAAPGRLHPNLSPVGDVVANVNTLDDAVIAIQAKVEKFVSTYCGANQTSTCQAAQVAAPVMRTAKVIGDGSVAIGDAFTVYLSAKDAVGQASAKATLLEKIVALQGAGLDLTTQEFTVIQPDVTNLVKNIKALTSSAQKGL